MLPCFTSGVTPARTMPTKKKASPSVSSVGSFAMPIREWDRATELVKMFAMTGWIANARAQSMLLISEPGSGKSELLDRFVVNTWLQFASDLTVQGLYPVLKMMHQGAQTHIVATEFQKFFLRKSSTAENTLGTLCQMMEEGVGHVMVGGKPVDFHNAQGGLIGAITHDTVQKWRAPLREFGFWSRCAAFEWEMPVDELRGVMRSISLGDKNDLSLVKIIVPQKRMHVDFPIPLSRQFEDFVIERMLKHTVLRVFQRFRALAMACALLDQRDVVHARDVEKVVQFDPYWQRMVIG